MPAPSFLCIGAQKAGTSWLFVQLARHPNVWMPPVKELHFFDHLYTERNHEWTTDHIRYGVRRALKAYLDRSGAIDWEYVRYLTDMATHKLFTKPWYLRCFDLQEAQGRICGDITPEYSTISAEGVQHVARMLPDVRVIYIIRDPVERALSQLRMNVERRGVKPAENLLLKMVDEPDIENRGDYTSYVPRWRARFGAEQLLVLPYGDIRADPRMTMRRVEQFIGASPFNGYVYDERVHQTSKFVMPDAVVAKVHQRMARQSAFLAAEFGADFLARTL
jgi:hypothetical protein